MQQLALFTIDDHRRHTVTSPRRDTTPTSTRNWAPDDNLITCAQAGQLHIRNLTLEDRAWIVAGLTARGVTAEDTATMLRCSLRLIKQIRAHPMTAVSLYAQTVAVNVETSVSKERAKNRAHAYELEDARMTAERYKRQRDELIDQLAKQARKAEKQNV